MILIYIKIFKQILTSATVTNIAASMGRHVTTPWDLGSVSVLKMTLWLESTTPYMNAKVCTCLILFCYKQHNNTPKRV